MADEPAGGGRGEDALAGGHHPDAVQQFAGVHVLEEETGGAGAQCVEDVRVEVEGGQHQDTGRVLPAGDDPGGGDAVQFGHADVHEDHVGCQFPGEAYRLGAVGGLADDRHVLLGVDHGGESRPYDALVVDDQHPEAHRCPSSLSCGAIGAAVSGSRTRTGPDGPVMTVPSAIAVRAASC